MSNFDRSNFTANTFEFPYIRPENLSWKKKLQKEIWNRDTNQILGRTPRNWGSLLIFYSIFFSALAAMFAICMKGMLMSIDERKPTYLLDSSLIGANPGLGFRPISVDTQHGSLIWYQASNESNYRRWVDQLDKFLEPYRINKKLPGGGKNQQVCDFDTKPDPGKVCAFDVKVMQPCTMEMGYSFNRSSPCIFIKLNKIFDWVPDYYDDPKHLPEEMPLDLKRYIRDAKPKELKQVWVSCRGEGPADKENIGPVNYIPRPGFPGYFYPYQNIDGYLSPVIAIHLARPKLNTLINIECRAWAKNIDYSSIMGHRQGSVHFEIMID